MESDNKDNNDSGSETSGDSDSYGGFDASYRSMQELFSK